MEESMAHFKGVQSMCFNLISTNLIKKKKKKQLYLDLPTIYLSLKEFMAHHVIFN